MTENPFILGLSIALVVGTLSKAGTLARSFAVAFDIFVQAFLWNDPVALTLSSRAGLAARKGKRWPAKVINIIMFSSTHCEEAIEADLQRAKKAISLLSTDGAA